MKISARTLALHYVLPLSCLAAGVATLFLFGTRAPAMRKRPPRNLAIPVSVIKPQLCDGNVVVESSGVVQPFREIELSAEIVGRVVFKNSHLKPGHYVRAGDELLRLDSRDYDLEVERLELQLRQSEASLRTVDVEIQNAERLVAIARESLALQQQDHARTVELAKRNAASQADVDTARMTVLASQQALTQLDNQLRLLKERKTTLSLDAEATQISLKTAKLDQQRTVIHAPISGLVVRAHVEDHSIVEPGTSLATIEDTSAVEILCHLRSDDVDLVSHSAPQENAVSQSVDQNMEVRPEATGDINVPHSLPDLPATIRFSRAGREYRWRGVLSRIDGQGVDTETRTIPCRVLVTQPHASEVFPREDNDRPLALIRGMFVAVELHCVTRRPLIAVPELAIRPGKKVWVVQDSKLQIQPVRIVRIEDANVLIDASGDGLSLSDRVIVSPVPNARVGLDVSVARSASGPGHTVTSESADSRDATWQAQTSQEVVLSSEKVRAFAQRKAALVRRSQDEGDIP